MPPDDDDNANDSDLVGLSEIARLAGISRQAAYNWVKRYDTFPEPLAVLSCGTIWHKAPVEEWIKQNTDPT